MLCVYPHDCLKVVGNPGLNINGVGLAVTECANKGKLSRFYHTVLSIFIGIVMLWPCEGVFNHSFFRR